VNVEARRAVEIMKVGEKRVLLSLEFAYILLCIYNQGNLAMKKNKHTPRKKTPARSVSQAADSLVEAKLFVNGGSQAVRLPKKFRFEGDSVYLKKLPDAVMILPKDDPWASLVSAFGSIPDFPDREEPEEQKRPELDHLFD
jgi:antitoxin VapB